MKFRSSSAIVVAAGLLLTQAGVSRAAESDPSLIREQMTVIVDGKPEVWRLVWGSKPVPICGVDDRDVSLTCPCSGFAYGEQAPLSLVRSRADGHTESLVLGTVFQKDNPIVGAGGGRALVRRWAPVESGPDSDWKHFDDDDFEARVARRPLSRVLNLADYDHDGQATEFLLQVDTLPCGKHQMVLVGISKANPHIHVFSSAEAPGQPLILGDWEWKALRDNAHPIDVIDWHCQDHGSDTQWKVRLSADSGTIHAAKTSRKCPDPTQSPAYRKLLKLNESYKNHQIPYDEFLKRKQALLEQLPGDPG